MTLEIPASQAAESDAALETMSPVSSAGSLFDDSDGANEQDDVDIVAARTAPPIPGLYVFPDLLPRDLAAMSLAAISEADHFAGGCRDQAMLFSAPPPAPCSLPEHIQALDSALLQLLEPLIPSDVLNVALRQPLARQAILNLYPPGQGISPHVDLPRRYADGIVGVSLTGGCVLTLSRADSAMRETGYGSSEGERYDVYLPPRSIYVLSGESRWNWAHGIEGREADTVADEDGRTVTLPRDMRVSVTLRWMKEGAGLLA